jgi:hypothetical protein
MTSFGVALPLMSSFSCSSLPERLFCVNLIYASSNMTVLTGNLFAPIAEKTYVPNYFVWQAVEEFRRQGYSMQDVLTTGSGVTEDPYIYHIIMTK